MRLLYTDVARDISQLPDFLTQYESILATAKFTVKISGNVEKQIKELPGHTEEVFCALQEVEALLNHFNIQLRKIRQKHFKTYLEGYARALTSRDAERYADADDEVIDMETIINEVALLRNKFLGIMKGLESKSFSLSNIVRLRVSGMEEISVH
jgi:tRNA-dihydrouridine synthase